MQNPNTSGASVIAVKFGVHATESKGVDAKVEKPEAHIWYVLGPPTQSAHRIAVSGVEETARLPHAEL